jgi:hypothetical protein
MLGATEMMFDLSFSPDAADLDNLLDRMHELHAIAASVPERTGAVAA